MPLTREPDVRKKQAENQAENGGFELLPGSYTEIVRVFFIFLVVVSEGSYPKTCRNTQYDAITSL